jgi:hypothetical protein
MERTVLSETSTFFADDRFAMVITILAPGHVLFTLYGYNDGKIADEYYKILDDQVAKAGFVHVYMDAREQSGVTSEERDRTARWTKALGAKYRGGHLLFRSRLLELAVAIVNLFTGGVVSSYSNVDAFEAAIRREIPGFKKLPVFENVQKARKRLA